MSSNLDLVRRIYADWERGDYSSAEWADTDIEFVIADGPAPGTWKGVAGIAEGWRGFLSAWEDWRAEVDEYSELDDDRVLVLVHWTGRGRTSGLELEQMRTRGASVFDIREGKVARQVLYFDRERALANLAAPPEGMARKKVELATKVFEAVARRDLSRLIALTDPEVEWHSFFAELGQRGVYRGHDAIRQYIKDLDDAWELLRPEVTDTLEMGEVVLLVGRLHYRGKASGIETEVPAGWMVRFRNEKVVCLRAFQKPEQTLGAIGLQQ